MGRNGAGVNPRGNSIQVTFSYEGKTHRKTVKVNGKSIPATAPNLKFAHRLLAEINEKIRHGTFLMSDYWQADGDVGPMLTGDYLWAWLDRQDIEKSTYSGYASAIRFLERVPTGTPAMPITQRPLRALKFSHIDELKVRNKSEDGKPLAGRTFNNRIVMLRDALDAAVLDDLIPKNPAAEVGMVKVVSSQPDPFSIDESNAIISEFAKRYPGQLHNLFEFWFWSGLRPSELFALQWSDIDFAKRTISVRKARVMKEVKGTKTGVERVVPFNPLNEAALKRQKDWTFLANAEIFRDIRPERLSEGDEIENSKAFMRQWVTVLQRLGIRYRSPRHCRHSFATAMLLKKMPPVKAAKIMGHSVQVFHKHYSRWMEGADDDAENQAFSEAVSKATNAQELHQKSQVA